jgi:hypothetical protein
MQKNTTKPVDNRPEKLSFLLILLGLVYERAYGVTVCNIVLMTSTIVSMHQVAHDLDAIKKCKKKLRKRRPVRQTKLLFDFMKQRGTPFFEI